MVQVVVEEGNGAPIGLANTTPFVDRAKFGGSFCDSMLMKKV
jgi:hypothetical protein